MLNLQCIKTPTKFFIRAVPPNRHPLRTLFFRGTEHHHGDQPEPTFHPDWFSVPEIGRVMKEVPQPNINRRFELIEEAPGRNELPSVMPYNEVMVESPDGDGCEWREDLRHLQSLYRFVSDEQPPIYEEVPFELEVIMELDAEPSLFQASFPATRFDPFKGTEEIGTQAAQHQVLDEIVFPPVLLPERPAKISSKQAYAIIRERVRRDIDGRYARITSDFDFCFVVKKVIPLHQPVEGREEITKANGKSYAKRRYREWLIKDRKVECFEMTHSGGGGNHRGHTPIHGFQGENHEDLARKIDEYLDNLMSRINEPLHDCPNCNGLGVIVEPKGGKNE